LDKTGKFAYLAEFGMELAIISFQAGTKKRQKGGKNAMENRSQAVEYKLYLGRNQGNKPIEASRLTIFFAIQGAKLPGFTLIDGLGFWEGAIEETLILVYIGTDKPELDRNRIKKVGKEYKAWFLQQAVYMTETLITLEIL
jgi:hypothetical protein